MNKALSTLLAIGTIFASTIAASTIVDNESVSASNPNRPVRQEIVTTTHADSVVEALTFSDSPVLFYNVPLNHDFMTKEADGFVTVSPEQKTVGYTSFACFGLDTKDNGFGPFDYVTCNPMKSESSTDGSTFFLATDDIEILMESGTVEAVFAIDHP